MLHGRHFVICGVNRLVVRVTRALHSQQAEVTVLRRSGEDETLLRLLPPGLRLIDSTTQEDVVALTEAGLESATCLLALADDDLDNLRIAVAARAVAPHIPVILRAFDPALADELEQGLNIRRAYSMSALAAPAFIAAACGDEVVETLRLGDGEVPICRLTVRSGSPLVGKTTAQIKSRFGCGVLARGAGNDWQPICGPGDNQLLAEGENVLIGGPLSHVLRLTLLNAGWLYEGRQRRRARRKSNAGSAITARRHRHGLTFLPPIAVSLFAILVLAVGVFASALHLRFVDAIYFVVTTATTTGYGDISLKDGPDWLKMFGCLVMLCGGALLGIAFSYLAAIATAERLDAMMGRRASRMRGHVIVAGLGNLGYRIVRLLTDIGMDAVAVEFVPNAPFAEAIRDAAPVLTGDARLPENLQRAAVDQAVALIGCTSDDLANIQACLHARRLNSDLSTVARVFDDGLAERLTAAFTIDKALSASQCAVSAFVGAAMDERALRPLEVGKLLLTACRYTAEDAVSAEVVANWRARGVRILAFRGKSNALSPPSELGPGLAQGDEVILCGPTVAVEEIMVIT